MIQLKITLVCAFYLFETDDMRLEGKCITLVLLGVLSCLPTL